VGILVLVHNSSVLELDVEVLVDRVECPANRQVVLKLHRHLLPHELLEVGEEQLQKGTSTGARKRHQKRRRTICAVEESRNHHGGGLTTLAAAGSADTYKNRKQGNKVSTQFRKGARLLPLPLPSRGGPSIGHGCTYTCTPDNFCKRDRS